MGAVDDVKPEQEANKLATLTEMAKTGNPYSTGAEHVQSIQSDALDSVARSAAARGVPQGGVDELTQIVRMPGDWAGVSMASGDGAFKSALNGYQATGAKYQGAAVPDFKAGSASAGGTDPGRYGGYGSATEYTNAVTAMARQLAQQQAEQAAAEQQSVVAQHEASPLYASARQDQASAQNRTRQQQAEQQDLKNQAQGEKWAKERELGILPGPAVNVGATTGEVYAPLVVPPMVPGGAANVDGYQRMVADEEAQQRAWQHEHDRVRAQMAAALLDRPIAGDRARGQYDEGIANPYTNPYTAPQIASWQGLTDQANDPTQLYRFAQEAAINQLGGDPYEAMGRFSPEWALGLATDDVSGPNKYASQQIEAQQRQANGGYTDAELGGFASRDRAGAADSVRSSAEYAAAAGDAEALLARLTDSDVKQGDVTVDQLRKALEIGQYSPEVADQIIKDFGPRFPSGSFEPTATDPVTGEPLG